MPPILELNNLASHCKGCGEMLPQMLFLLFPNPSFTFCWSEIVSVVIIVFPLHFCLDVATASPVANPSQPTALPAAQEQGRKVAHQLILVSLLSWSISRGAVRAGEQCKHPAPFSFPLPALRPHSIPAPCWPFPPIAHFPPSPRGCLTTARFLGEPAAKSIGSEQIQPHLCCEYSAEILYLS